ncbi:MAG: hypothetical protein LBJ59_10870 [Zoogloeaceae bacterium]|jgi:hypothetical protein|nr:hypothetical protein [Zoogloeaceae bacterium]
MSIIDRSNPCVSERHAAIMQKELTGAKTEGALKEIAVRHTRFLLTKDIAAMRDAYADALKRVRKAARDA